MSAVDKPNCMIQIRWLGHACFHIQVGGVSIITDPAPATTGYEIPMQDADIVTVSHQHWDHNAVTLVKGQPKILDQPGVFTAQGITLEGLPSFHDQQQGKDRGNNLIFRMQSGAVALAHLGDLGEFPDQWVMERLQGLDILLIPVGGIFTLDAEAAYDLTCRLRPKVVIPMHFQTKNLNFALEPVEKFILKFPRVQKVPRLDYLPRIDEEPTVVILDYLLTCN